MHSDNIGGLGPILKFEALKYVNICFWDQHKQWPGGQKMLFRKGTFCNFLPFYGLTSDAIFSVICPCRMFFNTIFENYKE